MFAAQQRSRYEKQHVETRALLCVKHHGQFWSLLYLFIQDFMILSRMTEKHINPTKFQIFLCTTLNH